MPERADARTTGLAQGTLAYLAWGVLPFCWKRLALAWTAVALYAVDGVRAALEETRGVRAPALP